MTTGKNNIRVWHERRKDGLRTGKTVAIIWSGNVRYVGVSHLPIEGFRKKIGFEIAIGRAQVALLGLRPQRWPEMFSFVLGKHRQSQNPEKLRGFLKTIPPHLFIEERADNEHAQAIRSEFS